MKNYNIALRPIHYASVSGGKDSLYMLSVILSKPEKYPLDLVVHYELEIDYPWVKNVIDYMEKELEKINVKLVRIKPTHTWEELYDKWGFPNRTVRWCNSKYKMDCTKQLEKCIKEQNCRPVAYIGFCADETKRFKYAIGNIEEGQDIIYPLAEEGYNEDDILMWARKQPIFDNYYRFNKRQGCMFCPMASMDNLAYLLYQYPTQYEKMMNMCRETEKRYNTSIFQSNPKYNTDYIDNRVRTKYLPKLLEEVKQYD